MQHYLEAVGIAALCWVAFTISHASDGRSVARQRRTESRAPRQDGIVYYVATNGNDRWSGRLPAPNRSRTDGPFASLIRARDAIRQLKSSGRWNGIVTVQIRGGTYYLSQPIAFTPQNSGQKGQPVIYMAYPSEKPVLCGGRGITGFKPDSGKLLSVTFRWAKGTAKRAPTISPEPSKGPGPALRTLRFISSLPATHEEPIRRSSPSKKWKKTPAPLPSVARNAPSLGGRRPVL